MANARSRRIKAEDIPLILLKSVLDHSNRSLRSLDGDMKVGTAGCHMARCITTRTGHVRATNDTPLNQ
jgi:hypothetical protein